jgi:hypothetical protein
MDATSVGSGEVAIDFVRQIRDKGVMVLLVKQNAKK